MVSYFIFSSASDIDVSFVLITRRPQVQILPPLPILSRGYENALVTPFRFSTIFLPSLGNFTQNFPVCYPCYPAFIPTTRYLNTRTGTPINTSYFPVCGKLCYPFMLPYSPTISIDASGPRTATIACSSDRYFAITRRTSSVVTAFSRSRYSS